MRVDIAHIEYYIIDNVREETEYMNVYKHVFDDKRTPFHCNVDNFVNFWKKFYFIIYIGKPRRRKRFDWIRLPYVHVGLRLETE